MQQGDAMTFEDLPYMAPDRNVSAFPNSITALLMASGLSWTWRLLLLFIALTLRRSYNMDKHTLSSARALPRMYNHTIRTSSMHMHALAYAQSMVYVWYVCSRGLAPNGPASESYEVSSTCASSNDGHAFDETSEV